MSRAFLHLSIGVGLLTVFGSCVPSSVTAQFAQQDKRMQSLQQQIADAAKELQRVQLRQENEERARWSQQLCKNTQVADFLTELQAGIPENCTAGSNEGALLFMNSQAYAISNLWPKEEIADLHPARMGQIRDLLDPFQIYPSTRYIILVQPEAENERARNKAQDLGAALKGLLLSEWNAPLDARAQTRASVRPRELRVLGPYPLPCRLRNEVSKRYNGPMDKALHGEPPEGKSRIRIWLFRTNC